MVSAHNEYEKLANKVDEMQEKEAVIKAEIARMTNEHEELIIKFDNLQNSLNTLSELNQSSIEN